MLTEDGVEREVCPECNDEIECCERTESHEASESEAEEGILCYFYYI